MSAGSGLCFEESEHAGRADENGGMVAPCSSKISESRMDLSPEDASAQSVVLVSRVRDGDQEAAEEIFRRYYDDLVRLVQKNMSPRLAARVGADDIAATTYRVFFTKNEDSRFVLKRSGDLWKLLVGIAMKKIHHEVNQARTQKRDMYRTQSISASEDYELPLDLISESPTPEQAVSVSEELEFALSNLKPIERDIFTMRLEGYTEVEIQARVNRSPRAIRRAMANAREILEARLLQN
jgi:RNA polymerase sigma-70 factor, ECF subfamily